MRPLNAFWAALAAACVFASPTLAADNYTVTQGSGKTMACKELSTVCFITHTVANAAGTVIDPATSTKQPALGTAGSPSADVISVQGVTSGTAIKTDSSATTQPVSGTVTSNLAAATTGGCTPYGLASAASTNSTSMKGSAGTLCSLSLTNETATKYYFRAYNLAAGPTCSSSTGYLLSIMVPASTSGAGIVVNTGPFGWAFPTGIAFCITGGATSTDNTSAATGVGVVASYK